MGAGGLIGTLVVFFAGWLFVKYLLLGLVAGYIAEKISSSDHTIWQNLGLGVLGSLAGGFAATLLHIQVAGVVGKLIVATVGALILLYGYRMYKQSSSSEE